MTVEQLVERLYELPQDAIVCVEGESQCGYFEFKDIEYIENERYHDITTHNEVKGNIVVI